MIATAVMVLIVAVVCTISVIAAVYRSHQTSN